MYREQHGEYAYWCSATITQSLTILDSIGFTLVFFLVIGWENLYHSINQSNGNMVYLAFLPQCLFYLHSHWLIVACTLWTSSLAHNGMTPLRNFPWFIKYSQLSAKGHPQSTKIWPFKNNRTTKIGFVKSPFFCRKASCLFFWY